MRKLSVILNGNERELRSAAVFTIGKTRSGLPRIVLNIPDEHAGLLSQLTADLPAELFMLYVLHTPRGEGEPGRYQSTRLPTAHVIDLLERYGDFFANDGRHDVWIHAPETGQTLIWDRHNMLFVEGEPLAPIIEKLTSLGFTEGPVEELGEHIHHYRVEYDTQARSLLEELDWYRTPLRPEDEQ